MNFLMNFFILHHLTETLSGNCLSKDNLSRAAPDCNSKKATNVDQELSSYTSGSSLHFPRATSFRFPVCFNVFAWICCIVAIVVFSLQTAEYVSKYVLIFMRISITLSVNTSNYQSSTGIVCVYFDVL